MTNHELDEILKAAPAPSRTPEYWAAFPKQVMHHLRQAPASAPEAAGPRPQTFTTARRWTTALRTHPAFAFGLAAACLAVGLFIGLHYGRPGVPSDFQLAEARKCYSEVTALFPNQLQALVLDATGGHLVLAPEPNVPISTPLYLKICGPNGCRRIVTFSGQRIAVNGISFEVLTDRQGEVLLVGEQSVWSSSQPNQPFDGCRIEARPLLTSS